MAGEYAPNVEGTWIGGGGDGMGTFVPSAPGRYVDIGGGGDQSNVVFVPDYVPQAPQPAPSWLAPEDYVATGYTSTGQPTPEAIQQYNQAVQRQNVALEQTGLSQTGVAPSGIKKAPDWLPKESYSLLGYNSAGNKTGDPLLDVPQNMPAKVMAAYQNILGRNPSQAELLHHVDVFSKKPDDYQWWLGSLSESPESINRVMTGKTDWKTVENNAKWLSMGYGFWTPTEESGLSKITNAIGSSIPYAALGIMTGGLGTLAGLGGAAAGALGGAVAGGTKGVMEGQNALQNALIGGALGGLGGAASQYLSGSPSLSGASTGTNIASGGLDLGSNYTFTLPSAPSAYPSLDFDPSIIKPPLYPDYFGMKYPIQTGGEFAYTGTGLNPAIENFYGYQGINPNLQYTTSGLANNAEALAYSSGIPIDRATFAGRGGLTGEQAAALDRALTRADYPGGEPYFPDEFPPLPKSGLPFDLSKLAPFAPLGIGAISKLVSPQTPAIVPPMTSGGQSYAPKGQVDYRPILDLLAPRQISRNLF